MKASSDLENYHNYLKSKSVVGDIYRRFLLYPRINRFLKGRTLDIGCGIGDFCAFRPNTDGADINPLNVKYVAKRGKSCYAIENNKILVDSAKYDSALMDNVLEHIENPRPILSEIHRILKPSGVLVVGVPGTKGYAADPDHKRFYSRAELIDLFEKNGFETNKVFSMPLKSEYLERKMKQYCIYAVFTVK